MARKLLPWLAIIPVSIAWLRMYGEHAGLYTTDVGTLLIEITYTFCLLLLVWITARSVNLIGKEKLIADKALKRSYDELEARVQERTSELLALNQILDNEIRERIKAEALVEAERNRTLGLLEKMPAYMILLTPDYNVLYSNQYFREIFGESKGKHCYEFLFNRTEPCEICESYKTLKYNKPHTWEWIGPNKHIYSVYDFPYSDSDGSPLIMEMGIDVTELKEAQQKLVLLNAELEHKVEKRTSDLSKAYERLDLLSQTSGMLLESGNSTAIISALCQKVMRFLDCQVFFIFLMDETSGKLHLNSYAGIPEKEAQDIEWLEPGACICGSFAGSVKGSVAGGGAGIVVEDIPENPGAGSSRIESLGIKAYACHPLLSNGEVIGTLSFGSLFRDQFIEEDISLMKSVAGQVATGVARIKNEDSLRASEERYRSLMELSPSASIVNRNNRIVLLNSAARNLFGVNSAEEILGKSPYELFHPDYHVLIRERIERVMKGETVGMVDEKIIRADGTFRDVEVVTAGITDSGEPAVQVLMNDITERVKTERAVLESRRKLELLNYQLKRELVERHQAEDALRKNESRLKELVATKDKFFGIIAHDLRNPFTCLLGSTEILLSTITRMDTENVKELAQILNDSAKSGYAILQNLLDWSRSQTGMIVLNPERIHLETIVRDNLDDLRYSSERKNIEVASYVQGDLFVTADKNMLNAILRNLLNNAVKFTHNSGKVSVTAVQENNEVTISVKDTGIGIPESKIGELFRIDSNYTRPGTDMEQGTGLGLKICRDFVEMHGGEIRAESTDNKGSNFIFTLPENGVNGDL